MSDILKKILDVKVHELATAKKYQNTKSLTKDRETKHEKQGGKHGG